MSFIKKGAVKPTELGTRPGLSGQTLVSTGLADLDKLLGGGLPLKTVTLLLEDSYTQHHQTLLKYFLAEGAANEQALHWSAGHDRHSSGARTLPQQVNHVPKEDAKDKQQETEEVQLRIAWQYRRYIKSKQKAAADVRSTVAGKANPKAKTGTAALGSVRDWCHNYDLTKPTSLQDLSQSRAVRPAVLFPPLSVSLLAYDHAYKEVASCADRAECLPAVEESPTFSGSEATQSLVADVRSFVSSLTQPSQPSPPQQPQQQQQQLPRGVNLPSKEAPHPLPSVAAPGISASEERNKGQDSRQHQLPGSPAAASTASPPNPTAYSGSGVRGSTGVTAPHNAQPSAPAKPPQPSVVQASLAERLQPSGASQSSSTASHDISQSGVSSVRLAAGVQAVQLLSGGGDSNAGSGTVKAQGVGRVGVESLGGLAWQLEGSDAEVEQQIYVAVFQLKAMIRDSRCAAMVSIPAGLYSSSLTARLAHLCDTVIGLEAVRDDSDIVRVIPEPARVGNVCSCCGLLHLQKLPSLNALGPPIPDITLFIIRHKRRRLAIQAVQIDPDAEAGEVDTKSAAAALCGGPAQAEKAFEF